jgi:hypothetical protein
LVSGPIIRAESTVPPHWVAWALAAALCCGLFAAFKANGNGSKVWAPEHLPPGPWEDRVFCAPVIQTPRVRGASALRTTLALLPWGIALFLFS